MKMRIFIKLSVFRLFFSYSSTRVEREGRNFHPTYIYMSFPVLLFNHTRALSDRDTGIVTLVPMQLHWQTWFKSGREQNNKITLHMHAAAAARHHKEIQ